MIFNFKKFKPERKTFVFFILSKINLKLLVTLICFAFLGNSIYGNFDSLSNQIIGKQEILWLLGGTLFSLLSIIINAYAWKFLINNIGCNTNNLNIIKIFLATNIYKYLPGGIWHFVTRYNKLRHAFSIEKSVEAILLEPLLMLIAGLIFIPFGNYNLSISIICWLSTLIFIPVFREFIIKKLKIVKANIFIKNNNVNDIYSVQNNKNITSKTIYPYKPLFVEIMFVLFRFYGFLCCMNAFSIGSLTARGELISSFSLAWVIGLIVPAAPGGLGVFESVVLFNLGSQLPDAPLLASLLCYRLISTIADILAAFLFPVKRLLKF